MEKGITRAGEAAGSRERVAAFLIELNRAVHRLGVYPSTHPLIPATMGAARDALLEALRAGPALRLHVSGGELLHEGRTLLRDGGKLEALAVPLRELDACEMELTAKAGESELHSFAEWLRQITDLDGSVSPGLGLLAGEISGITVRRGPAMPPAPTDERWLEFLASGYASPTNGDELRDGTIRVVTCLLKNGEQGEDGSFLMETLAGPAIELLREGRFDEAREPVAVARRLIESQPGGGDGREAAGRVLDFLRSDEMIGRLIDKAEQLVPGDPGGESALVEIFAATGAEGVHRVLLELAQLPPGTQREKRVHLLAESDPDAILVGFGRLLSEESVETICGALPVLRRVPLREANMLAQELASHPDPRIRVEAFRTLVMVDRRQAAFDRHLETALYDTDSAVRSVALGLVEGRAGDASCSTLRRFISGEMGEVSSDLKLQAVSVLAAIPTSAARDALVQVLLNGRFKMVGDDLRVLEIAERALLKWDDPASRAAVRRWKLSPSFLASRLGVG